MQNVLVETIVDEIIDIAEWDFYYNVYLPRTENIRYLFNKIEENHEKIRENLNGSDK